MKPKTLAILATVVLVLGAFIWFVERDLPGTDARTEQARKVLGGLETDDVESVDLSVGDLEVRLEREAGGAREDAETASWRLTSPVEFPADSAAVDRLLLTLTRLEKQTSVDEPDVADLGLEPPEASVRIRASGEETTLQVGVDVPVTGGRVVSLVGEDEVWVTEGELWDEITRDPEAWRSKRAVPFSASDIVRLRLSGEGRDEPVEIVRDDAGGDAAARFRLLAPMEDAADRQTVQDLTSRLATLRIEDFLDDPEVVPDDVDLASPRFVVELYDDGGDDATPYRLDLVARRAEEPGPWLARVEDEIVEIQALELAELLDRPAFAWRSHLLTDLQIFELDEVRVRQQDRDDLVLARKDGDWVRDGDALPYGPVRELLLQLTGSRAVEVDAGDEDGPSGLTGEPRLVFELKPNVEGLPTETVSVYEGDGTGVPVVVEPRGLLLRFEDEVTEGIDSALEGVREAEPLEPDAESEAG